jgi:hypothetical protein
VGFTISGVSSPLHKKKHSIFDWCSPDTGPRATCFRIRTNNINPTNWTPCEEINMKYLFPAATTVRFGWVGGHTTQVEEFWDWGGGVIPANGTV